MIILKMELKLQGHQGLLHFMDDLQFDALIRREERSLASLYMIRKLESTVYHMPDFTETIPFCSSGLVSIPMAALSSSGRS